MTSLSARKAAVLAALVAGVLIASTEIQLAQQPSQRSGRGPVDPRVQQRTYVFAETGEKLPYAVFVSSKVSKDKKNPLIVALQDSAPGAAVVAQGLRAALTARLRPGHRRLEHVRADQQQDEAHFRPHPRPEAVR
jgi:predicted peptidase